MRPRRRTLAVGLLAAAAAAALVVFGLAPSKGAKTGRQAPALPTERLAGPPVTLSSLLAAAHGRPSLVVFWASWCDPCMSEAPALESFSRTAQGRGRIVGVDWSDPRPGAVSFVRRYGWTFPTLRDGEGTVGNEYRLTNLPTTFVLDGKGRIEAALRGPQTVASLSRALAGAERA
jgi:thiol-disulfide isomerase/thioredoxin